MTSGSVRVALIALATAALLIGAARALARDRAPGAHTARTLDGTDTAHLHLVRQGEAQNESLLYEEGSATGALPGRMRAKLTVGSEFVGTCTIDTSHGSITGRGTATPHGTGRYQSFDGTLLIITGSGRYSHVHGRTRLSGTFDRRSFNLVVQTTGRLSY